MLLNDLLAQISNNTLPQNSLLIVNDSEQLERNMPDNNLSRLKSEEILTQLVTVISPNSFIKSISLGNQWSHWDFEQCSENPLYELSEKLKNHLHLKKVSIHVGLYLENNVSQLLQFLNCLTGTACIEELVLNFSFHESSFISGLTHILNENCSLKKISISGKPIAAFTEPHLLYDLLDCLKKKPLKTLNISFLPMNEQGILNLLQNNQQHLKKLSLRGCDLKNRTIGPIEKFLKEKNTIIHLNLALNPLSLNNYHQLNDILAFNKKNQIIKKRQRFINSAIVLCQGYCQPETYLSLLAVELMIKILCYLGNRRTYSKPDRVYFCSLVLVQNLNNRRALMTSKSTMGQKINIAQWWSSIYSFKESTIHLFKSSSVDIVKPKSKFSTYCQKLSTVP